MAGYRRYELIEHKTPFFYQESSIFTPFTTTKALSAITRHTFPPSPLPFAAEAEDLSFALDVFNPPSSLFNFIPSPLDPITDELIQIETGGSSSSSYYKRVLARRHCRSANELYLETLCDRVTSLEKKFDRMLKLKGKNEEEDELEAVDRKYTWTTEIKGGVERKYKVTAVIKGDTNKKKKKKKKKEDKNMKKGKGGGGERYYKWEAEFKGKGDEKKCYKWEAKIGGKKEEEEGEEMKHKKEKKHKGEKKEGNGARIVEIDEGVDHRAEVLRQAYARRFGASSRGKKKELSPQDAAVMIQLSFRDYLIRRSRALRALRELAIAKTKLKEIRSMFHNFSYRSRVARDAEERQKFTERIIVLLLTVDAIEGVDVMVRSAKRSMVDELEAMLDVVDPQPGGGRSLSMRRRTFDMPSGEFSQEMAEGVAHVVQMLDDEENASEA